MKTLIVATVVTLSTAAGSVAQTPSGTAKEITVTGCVQTEVDYRRAQDKGRGGVAGTGVGAGNEFVLTNASTDATKPGTDAYELTGPNEKLAAGHVGHRVAITGMLKGSASGGPTAGAPPRGVDVVSKDLQLRELEVTTVKMIAADCAK
jgi:hypothetical protein